MGPAWSKTTLPWAWVATVRCQDQDLSYPRFRGPLVAVICRIKETGKLLFITAYALKTD